MASNRQTGRRAASDAGKTLRQPGASKASKAAAASTLAQTGSRDVTGPSAASDAGKTLRQPGASKAQKAAAASALAQTPTRKRT